MTTSTLKCFLLPEGQFRGGSSDSGRLRSKAGMKEQGVERRPHRNLAEKGKRAVGSPEKKIWGVGADRKR